MSTRGEETIFKLQGGTGKHIDGDVSEPLQGRPFQALVQVTAASATANDGSLHVLPGFHAAAERFFELAKLPPPQGGFTPLTEESHSDLLDDDLWVPVRRMSRGWRHRHRSGRLGPVPAATNARGRSGLVKALRQLAQEVSSELASHEKSHHERGRDSSESNLESNHESNHESAEASAEASADDSLLPQPGDYILWDPRLPHTTGEKGSLNSHELPRQVAYCAYVLASESVPLTTEQRSCRESGLHPSWAPSSQRHLEASASYRRAPLTPLGELLYGYRDLPGSGHRHGPRRGAPEGLGGAASEAASAALLGEWEAGWEASAPSEMASKTRLKQPHGAPPRSESPRLLSQAHVDFFIRYGYVVVENALEADLVEAIGAEVKDPLFPICRTPFPPYVRN